MTGPPSHLPGVPFFLPAAVGQRLCVYHAPPPGQKPHAAVLYVPPFGEEMNKTRRMAALQARAFARAGVAVLLIDPYGCGDSSGDFADARWDIWKDDLGLAHAWLAGRAGVPVMLWGLRLGALLALDYAEQAWAPVNRFLLWQPVFSGEAHMTRLLRIRLANEMLGADADADPSGDPSGRSTSGLRDAIRRGKSLEVAGYEIAAALYAAIDAVSAVSLAPTGSQVDWFEIVADASRPVPPASLAAINNWKDQGVDLRIHCVPGAPFWSTSDIAECPALVDVTVASAATPATATATLP